MRHIGIIAAVFALVIAAFVSVGRSAAGFPIPGIPGVPLDPQTVAINAAAKQLAPYVAAKAPVILDWNSVYPTTQTLPGGPFSPAANQDRFRASLERQLAHTTTGIVNLPPGDYSLAVRVYCTDIHRHAGHEALWLMGPLHGARANVLAALYGRASGRNLSFGELQQLSWAMQAGMRYDELNPTLKGLVNQLIPDFRAQIAGSFLDQVQGQWNTWASTIPGLPSMDSALGRMGDAGQTVLNIKYARDTILADAGNFDAMSRALAPPGGSGADQNAGQPPWSIVADKLYERIITPGHFGSTSDFQIRVVGPAVSVPVPVTNVIGYPPSHHDWQPLTQESPTFAVGTISVTGHL